MKRAIIIGAGPAGLTAAYELLKATGRYEVIILEETDAIGGISRTVRHNGNRMDIGGHRFFSKDKGVTDWWQGLMPIQGKPAYDDRKLKRQRLLPADGPDPEKEDGVMLIRQRVSRIYYGRKFFDYPITMKPQTFINMGFVKTLEAGFSYMKSSAFKRREDSLEDFYINRFGRVLYSMFFEGYTEKLWGRHPREISADWGAQRVKGLSILAVFKDMALKLLPQHMSDKKNVETSLIVEFHYPKYGPGHLWETAAGRIEEMGGKLRFNCRVTGLVMGEDGKITAVKIREGYRPEEAASDGEVQPGAGVAPGGGVAPDSRVPPGAEVPPGAGVAPDGAVPPADSASAHGGESILEGDVFISSMPLKDLVAGMGGNVPEDVAAIAAGLPYRDFVTVGLLLDRLSLKNTTDIKTLNDIIPDCWIYVQDAGVKLGRIQIFNNWSPYMVKDVDNTIWIGLEFFCNENDEFWRMSEDACVKLATEELIRMGVIDASAKVLDFHRERVKKAYPAYFDTYARMDELIQYLDTFSNLYCVGRNGQHRYNNMDHSMATSFEAVKSILTGTDSRESIWKVNTEQSYHEKK